MTITGSEPTTRPARRAAGTVLVWLLVLPGAVWAVLRLGGWERGPLVQLFAFTPYAVVWAVVPALVGLMARRWLAAAVAAVALSLLVVCVLPRVLPDPVRGPTAGVPLQV